MIKEGKMENSRLVQFLKEDELLYNNKRINDLISIADFIYKENIQRKNECSSLRWDNYEKEREIKDLKKVVENLKDNNNSLNEIMDSITNYIKRLERKLLFK